MKAMPYAAYRDLSYKQLSECWKAQSFCQTKEELVRSGRAVSLPKDAPMALRKAAGLAVRAARGQDYGVDL